ncbi:unnamed protein product [Peronospora belbahrii]|uniref:Uncharacterized protein n=1 Tax=Peronospora belbahrii TaxID=622444 RepID=A0AAU9L3E3_9STRA|nr:unnamed protein product [Peronospora belbahrii]CAH0518530.1 unnamed protein product [Peronospora belbahrii]
MYLGDVLPALDFDDSDAESAASQRSLQRLLAENIPASNFLPQEVAAIRYKIDSTLRIAQPTGLVKPNYYSPLCNEELDPDAPQWHYDLELRQDDEAEACLKIFSVHTNSQTYIIVYASCCIV